MEQRKISRIAALVAAAVTLGLASTAEAAERKARPGRAAAVAWQGSGGWGEKARYQRLYDSKRVTTIRGTVVRLEPVRPFAGMEPGVQALVKTSRGVVAVHLGPRWFIAKQDARLAPKQMVEVTGAIARFRGRRTVIASEVVAQGRTMKLRDGLGLPLWSWARQPQAPRAAR